MYSLCMCKTGSAVRNNNNNNNIYRYLGSVLETCDAYYPDFCLQLYNLLQKNGGQYRIRNKK